MQLPCSIGRLGRRPAAPRQSSQNISTNGVKTALLPGPSLPAGVTPHLPGALGPADQSFDWQLGMTLINKEMGKRINVLLYLCHAHSKTI